MQGREFIEVARNLVRTPTEASLRSAIGRAYYAVLNAGAELLTELGFHVQQGPGKHGQVHNYFFNSGNKQLHDFSVSLAELRRKRNEADYDMESKSFSNRNTCALQVALAELMLQTLSACQQEPLRQQIQNGIREYERVIKA